MKYLLLSLTVIVLAGCQTDSQGNRETAWETLKRWDDSMNDTEGRLQSKSYRD